MDDRENPNHPEGPLQRAYSGDPDRWKAERDQRTLDWARDIKRIRRLISEMTVEYSCTQADVMADLQPPLTRDDWA